MLDEKLFAQFSRVGGARRIFRDLLTPNAATQEVRFLAGELQHPNLYYAAPDPALLLAEMSELTDMRGVVDAAKATWPDPIAAPLAKLYDHAIFAAIHERQLLVQAYSPDRPYNAQAFMTAQKSFYGNAHPELFWFCLQGLAQKADMAVLQQDTSPAGRELVVLFERAQHEAIAAPPVEIHPLTRLAFEPLLKIDEIWDAIIPQPDGLVDITEVFTAALTICSVQNWHVVHYQNAPNLAIRKATKEIIVSDEHRFLPAKQVLSKTLHEISVHARRSQTQSNVALYNAGLPGYHVFEEGLACVMADIQHKRVHVNGQRLYAGIGLALGLDGTPRDFREVFELLWRIDVAHGHDPLQARKTAYKRCRRLFRGAHPATRGNCHFRDKAYVEGIFAVLGFFARTPMTPELAADLLTYRFTPTDTAQQKLITFIKQK